MKVKFLLTITLLSSFVRASSIDKLNSEVAIVSSDTANVEADFQRIRDDTNSSKSVLLAAGIISAQAGNTVSVDLTLLPGSFLPTAVQAAIISPPGFTLTNVIAGPEAIAANKQVSFSSGTFLVFGLNQTVMNRGVLATAEFTISSMLKVQPCSIGLKDPVASDASGKAIPISVVSGTVIIQ